MARTRYAPDRGLTVRMTATMFLLGLVFVAFVALLIGIMIAAHASGAAIVLVALIFGGGAAVISLFYSDKIALAAAGAVEVSPQEEPELHGMVDRLCALADMDKPRVAIAPADMPNAFATGRNSKNSVLVVTEGLQPQAGARRARGRARARAEPRGAQGRPGHDLREPARDRGRPAGPVRVLLGAVRRRPPQQQPERVPHHPGDHGRLRGRLRDQLPAHPAAVPVPGAGGGPQRRAAHRPAELAGERPAEGQHRHGADPDPGPARRRAAERLLLRPRDEAHRRRRQEPVGAVLHPPGLEKRLEQLAKIQQQLGQAGPPR